MKKLLLSILLPALFVTLSNAQGNFAPVGTIWHYDIYNGVFMTNEPVIIQSVDTITIGGRLCNEISLLTANTCAPEPSLFVYESNDSVYMYVPSINSFSVLYNFNAAPGDSIPITCETNGSPSNFTMIVDSVGTVIINGNIRKLISWHWTQQWSGQLPLEMYGPVIEGLGDMSFLFPQIAVCDPQPAGMRCYQDSIIGLYMTGLAPDCDTVFTVGIDKFSILPLQIHPNPVFNSVEIRSPQEFLNATVCVFDLNGKSYCVDKNFTGNEYKFDASKLPAGVYSLKIADRQKTHVTKLVKM